MVGSDHGRWTRHGNTREWNGFKGEVKREHTRRKNAWMDGWMDVFARHFEENDEDYRDDDDDV